MSFWDEVDDEIELKNMDDGITDLFSLLDNTISQYLNKWDRSTLVRVIILTYSFIYYYFLI